MANRERDCTENFARVWTVEHQRAVRVSRGYLIRDRAGWPVLPKAMTIRLISAALLCMSVALPGADHRPLLARAPAAYVSRPNPFEQMESAAKAGEKIYRRECSSCHGENGQGSTRGPALKSAPVRRAQPGAIFWVLRNGSLRAGMPSFSHLPEPQRWQVITYLKQMNR